MYIIIYIYNIYNFLECDRLSFHAVGGPACDVMHSRTKSSATPAHPRRALEGAGRVKTRNPHNNGLNQHMRDILRLLLDQSQHTHSCLSKSGDAPTSLSPPANQLGPPPRSTTPRSAPLPGSLCLLTRVVTDYIQGETGGANPNLDAPNNIKQKKI